MMAQPKFKPGRWNMESPNASALNLLAVGTSPLLAIYDYKAF